MVDRLGSAIAADNTTVVRYDPNGHTIWATTTPGGTPVSPNITDSGSVVLATYNGPLSAYDVTTGAPLGSLWLDETLVVDGQDVPGFFDTINTPAVAGNRMYVSTQFHRRDDGPPVFVGRLYAVDVVRPDPNGPARFTIAWYFQFLAPSGGSPLLAPEGPQPVVCFDGAGPTAPGPISPTLFALRDHGSTFSLHWQTALPGRLLAAPARDPRGGLWLWPGNGTELLRLSMVTGLIRETIDVDALVGETGVHMPTSSMSISMNGTTPVMVVAAWTKTSPGTSYVIAIDLSAATLAWKIALGSTPQSVAFGQYPILTTTDGRPVVVFSTFDRGVWGGRGGLAPRMVGCVRSSECWRRDQ